MSVRTRYAVSLLACAVLAMIPLMANAQQQLTITNGPVIEHVGSNSAEIAWTTSIGASSVIHYGTDPNNLSATAQEPYQRGTPGHHVTHRVTIQGLQPNTTYYFSVDSGQGQGTGTEVKSPVQSFRTKGGASGESAESSPQERQPVKIIDGPRVEGVGNNWAVIAWTTNAASSSVVRFGTSPGDLTQTAMAPYADSEGAAQQTHRVRITNLRPNTAYYFVVDSGQGEGTGTEAKSQVAQFKTTM